MILWYKSECKAYVKLLRNGLADWVQPWISGSDYSERWRHLIPLWGQVETVLHEVESFFDLKFSVLSLNFNYRYFAAGLSSTFQFPTSRSCFSEHFKIELKNGSTFEFCLPSRSTELSLWHCLLIPYLQRRLKQQRGNVTFLIGTKIKFNLWMSAELAWKLFQNLSPYLEVEAGA